MNTTQSATWRNYAPTIVLLGVLVVSVIVAFSGGAVDTASTPVVFAIKGVFLVLIGLIAGFLGGIIGTGGCSVMLPAIHFWMGYPAPIAVGTTLFAVIFTAISGGYGHLVRKNLDVRATFWLGGAGILGVLLGSWLFTLLTNHVSLLGLILGLAFLWPAIRMSWEGLGRRTIPKKEGNSISEHKWGFSIFGFIIGVLTGIVG